jgi:glycosyltransferase involved in cell wall biosynthesis
MNILYVLNSGKPGGMEKHVLDLVNGMISKGHTVYVICNEGEIVEWYVQAGAQVSTAHIRSEIDKDYIKELISFIKENQIQVIHSHELKAVTNATLAGLFSGVKCRIGHTHTPISEWQVPSLLKKIYTIFTIIGYSMLVNLFMSREMALTMTRKKTKKREGMLGSKVKVIPNGLDFQKFKIDDEQRTENRKELKERFSIPENAFVIGNVSRLTPEKGHSVLIRGFTSFVEKAKQIGVDEDFYLFIAGGGELESEIRSLSCDYNIEERVIITGVFDDAELPKFYSAFDIFVFPSFAEGFGYVLVEAMYSKVPVLASDLDVLKEVSQKTVAFFRTKNHVDLAEKLQDLYLRIKKKNDLVTHPLEVVEENYSMEKFIERYEKLYKEILNKK